MFTRKKDILALVDLIEAKENKLQEQIDYLECRLTDNRVNTEGRLEDIETSIGDLRSGYERLDKWDDHTREKFSVLARHFGVEIQHKIFNEQFEVIELNDDEATEITTNNQ